MNNPIPINLRILIHGESSTPSIPLVDSRSANRLCFLLISFLILPVFTLTTVMAQTEVSGEVSGAWTPEDSPFIVMDSTWIPEDEELFIWQGVDVLFEEGLGIDAFGILTVQGTEEDSVRFLPNEDVESWRGLRLYKERGEYGFIYCRISGCENCFSLQAYIRLTLDHSDLNSLECPLEPLDWRNEGNRIVVYNSVINGGRQIYFHFSSFYGRNSIVRTGFGEDWGLDLNWGSVGLDSCTVYGECRGDLLSSVYTHCRFLAQNDSVRCGATVTIRMIDCYVEGGCGTGEGRREVTFENNIIEGKLSANNCDSVIIRNNDIGGYVHLSDGNSLVEDCRIRGSFRQQRGSNLILRNCNILNYDDSEGVIVAYVDGEISIERCFIKGKIFMREINQIFVKNNTIIRLRLL